MRLDRINYIEKFSVDIMLKTFYTGASLAVKCQIVAGSWGFYAESLVALSANKHFKEISNKVYKLK